MTSTVISWWNFQSTMIEYQRISLGLWLYFTNQHFLKNMFFWDKTCFPGSYLNLFLGFLWIFFNLCGWQLPIIKGEKAPGVIHVVPGGCWCDSRTHHNAVSEDQSSGRNIHLVAGWSNPFEKDYRQLESYFPRYTRVKIKNSWSSTI